MNKTKQWFQSKTIIASIVAIVLIVIKSLGLDIDKSLVSELVVNIASVVAILIAIYGRIIAKEKIK